MQIGSKHCGVFWAISSNASSEVMKKMFVEYVYVGMAFKRQDYTFWCADETKKNIYTWSKTTMVGHNNFVGPLPWRLVKEQFPEGGFMFR